MKSEKKGKRLRLFDLQREGKGISKKQAELGWGLKKFFISFKENFNKILYCNIFMVLGNFPILFLIATIPGYTKIETFGPFQDLFQNLMPVFNNTPPSPFSMTLYAMEGLHNLGYGNTTLTYVFYGISALSLLTFGIVNVGTCYILRNIAKGEPVFVWTDFWYAVKRNWKQALPFGMIDLGINAILIYNIVQMLFGSSGGSFFTSTMMWSNIVIFLLYFFMRYYIYIQMVTFKLTVFKIIKNSLIFALLGIKRNFAALGGILAFVLLEVIFLFAFGTVLLPLAVAFPLIIMLSGCAYMKVYAAYYKVKTVMIDPYLAEHPEQAPEEYDDEVIMRDDVTDRERLAEIKKRNNVAE